MRASRYILTTIIGLIFISCSKNPSDYKPFSDFDFKTGEYRLYGFIHEGGGSDFFDLHKDFYIESISVLDSIQTTWIFDSTNKRMPCGWEYELCLVHQDSLVKLLKVNTDCKYLISKGWFEFNPDLWNQIPTDKVMHLDREEARNIRENLFSLKEIKIPKVFVLPPYDKIANRGISPNIQECIENKLSSIDSINLIPFSFKDMMGVAYQNIFDKKYCKPILERVSTDFIVLSKIDLRTQTGKMGTDTWDFEIKIYDINRGFQFNSLKGENLTSKEMCDYIEKNIEEILIDLELK
ncbi:hypothetical protein ACE01N_20445 [Saccharicrinis sp. FJH2]|uniref:hypothetical protein n=1 Tax=Saccharicrinis sp. FJH65 TaxID=3344659 RepID=UPI0035F355AC